MLIEAGSEINAFSGARLKHDIETFDEERALDIVSNTRSVSFRYNANPEEKKYGWIAQELEGKLDDLISTVCKGDEEEQLVLNQQGLVPVLWAAVRKLTSKVEFLEAKLEKRDD